MQNIYRMFIDFGRMGDLDGLFTATPEDIESLTGKEVYFGEVLGKHSEIVHTFDGSEFELVTDDPYFMDMFVKIIGSGTISGYNPFDYMESE